MNWYHELQATRKLLQDQLAYFGVQNYFGQKAAPKLRPELDTKINNAIESMMDTIHAEISSMRRGARSNIIYNPMSKRATQAGMSAAYHFTKFRPSARPWVKTSTQAFAWGAAGGKDPHVCVSPSWKSVSAPLQEQFGKEFPFFIIHANPVGNIMGDGTQLYKFLSCRYANSEAEMLPWRYLSIHEEGGFWGAADNILKARRLMSKKLAEQVTKDLTSA